LIALIKWANVVNADAVALSGTQFQQLRKQHQEYLEALKELVFKQCLTRITNRIKSRTIIAHVAITKTTTAEKQMKSLSLSFIKINIFSNFLTLYYLEKIA
jgi:ribosomal protein L13